MLNKLEAHVRWHCTDKWMDINCYLFDAGVSLYKQMHTFSCVKIFSPFLHVYLNLNIFLAVAYTMCAKNCLDVLHIFTDLKHKHSCIIISASNANGNLHTNIHTHTRYISLCIKHEHKRNAFGAVVSSFLCMCNVTGAMAKLQRAAIPTFGVHF